MNNEQFEKLCATFGFAPSRSLRELLDAAVAEPACCCGDPAAAGVVHRRDGPCYMAEPVQEPVAGRAFLERILAAMEGVIDVADRKTDEFDALRSSVIDLTLMLHTAPPQRPAVANEIHGCHGGEGSTLPEQPVQEPHISAPSAQEGKTK